MDHMREGAHGRHMEVGGNPYPLEWQAHGFAIGVAVSNS